MSEFTIHTKASAPEASQSRLPDGFLPNLHAVMAESPAMIGAYKDVGALYAASDLTPLEQQVVLMTANFVNDCHYCVPWHTLIMKNGGMPDDVIDALRDGTPIADPRLEALRTFTRELIEHRGHVGDERLRAFLDAGWTTRAALDVVVGLALKTMSNYVNALAHTPLDDPPKAHAWTKPVASPTA